jgi:Fusaric acid resistance protein-like
MTTRPAGQPAPAPAHLTVRSLRPTWSVAAAMRALRATIVVPVMLWLSFEVIGNIQVALFAVFGSFAALVLTSFGGSRRNKAEAHLGLAVVGSIGLILGSLASGSAWLATIVTLGVAFAIYFGGMIGPYAATGVTGVLLAYVIAVTSSGGIATIPDRLAGWWMASVVSTVAVLTLSPRSPGDRLRQCAAALARAVAAHLRAAVDGVATQAGLDAALAAKHELVSLYEGTPYRPTGLAAPDQALVSLISLLEWCTSLTCEAVDGHLDLSGAAAPDLDLLSEASAALAACAECLDGRDDLPDPERVWKARLASAIHLRGLTGEPASVRLMAEHAFHAQAIGIAASAAAADTLIAAGRVSMAGIAAQRHRWLATHVDSPVADGEIAADGTDGSHGAAGVSGPVATDGASGADGAASAVAPLHPWRRPPPRAGATIAADASIRSVWFRNSVRGAVAIAAAVLVAKMTNVEHAFWVVLGTLSVLRTSAGATGSTALRALGGTALGFVVGAALLVGIGTSPAALWVALVLAVVVAAYTPGTAPFVVGQAAFTVTVVVLYNLLVPTGWQVGLLRVEDVAIGCAVSLVAGALFWPRGASVLVADNLADAFRAGASHLTDATAWVLGGMKRTGDMVAGAAAANIRLDDAVRAYLTEQGSKRLAKDDLRTLTMSALRLRLTAHSLASLPGLEAARGPAAEHPVGPAVRAGLRRESDDLADFYVAIAAEVSKPGLPGSGRSPQVPLSDPVDVAACTVGPAHFHPEALWVGDHLSHLASHSAALIGPAARLAALRRRPWWR